MPVYEYLCHTCDSRFEVRRSMSEAAAPMSCPDGHADTTRLLSVFASVGGSSGPGAAAAVPAARSAGGCGAGCGCAH